MAHTHSLAAAALSTAAPAPAHCITPPATMPYAGGSAPSPAPVSAQPQLQESAPARAGRRFRGSRGGRGRGKQHFEAAPQTPPAAGFLPAALAKQYRMFCQSQHALLRAQLLVWQGLLRDQNALAAATAAPAQHHHAAPAMQAAHGNQRCGGHSARAAHPLEGRARVSSGSPSSSGVESTAMSIVQAVSPPQSPGFTQQPSEQQLRAELALAPPQAAAAGGDMVCQEGPSSQAVSQCSTQDNGSVAPGSSRLPVSSGVPAGTWAPEQAAARWGSYSQSSVPGPASGRQAARGRHVQAPQVIRLSEAQALEWKAACDAQRAERLAGRASGG